VHDDDVFQYVQLLMCGYIVERSILDAIKAMHGNKQITYHNVVLSRTTNKHKSCDI